VWPSAVLLWDCESVRRTLYRLHWGTSRRDRYRKRCAAVKFKTSQHPAAGRCRPDPGGGRVGTASSRPDPDGARSPRSRGEARGVSELHRCNLPRRHVVTRMSLLRNDTAPPSCPPSPPKSGRIHEGVRDTSSLALRAPLLKATRSQDLDEAFEKVLSEYLELKIAALQETTDRLEEKWGMEFSTFKQRLADDDLPDDAYSYDVEQDYWEWEEAETLKAHYQQVQAEWTQKCSGRLCT